MLFAQRTVSPGTGRNPNPQSADKLSVRMRVLGWQIDALDQTALSGTANFPAVVLSALIIRRHVETGGLYVWTAAMALLAAILVATVFGPLRRREQKHPTARTLQRDLALRVAIASGIGAVWGGGALVFAQRLDHIELLFLMCIVLGCNAACISGLGSYLPAFFGYCLASALPLALATFMRHDAWSDALSLLILLFAATVGVNARLYNRQVLGALRLRAENETLAETVVNAKAATIEATRAKWNTLAHLSHELRTPMNAIIGFSQMMREEMFGPLGTRYLSYARHIHDSGRLTLELIDSILEVAEAGHIALSESEFSLAELVDECIDALKDAAAAKRAQLARELPGQLRLNADRGKLRQALLNILTNAIRYSHRGGSIEVRAMFAADGLAIAIRDEGVGIAPADLEKCLEPFVRMGNPLIAGVSGAGLGLPMARRLVEAHGGCIALASVLGHGATATIHLPASRVVAEEKASGPRLASAPEPFTTELTVIAQGPLRGGVAAQ